MTPCEPDVVNTAKYGITAAAKKLGISMPTLRKYLRTGLVKYGISRLNGRRFIYGSELKRAWRARL